MGFVVMLYVDDIDTAHGVVGGLSSTPVRPVGIFTYPTRGECKCTGNCTSRRGVSSWRRHKDGHMMCAECGYRHRDTRKRIIGALFDYLGANLMRTRPPAAFRTPDGYGPEDR